MISAYVQQDGNLHKRQIVAGEALPAEAVWIDLLEPDDAESLCVEEALGLELPTREEMKEIEISSRLYMEGPISFMTASVLARSATDRPTSVPVTFVLTGKTLVTVRYGDPTSFRQFCQSIERGTFHARTSEEVLAGLLDAVVDRIADIIERVQYEMDELSSKVFMRHRVRGDVNFDEVLRQVGMGQGLVARARDSLLTVGRVVNFVSRPGETKPDKATSRLLKTVARDISSLNDHVTFLSNNINFLLSATLGMINNEQTTIIKIFSVVAVVLLPPTWVASVYGMNFQFMPELSWEWGYPMSIGLMVLAAVLPYLFFKYRRWL